jgi:hypothetical protein
MADLILQRVGGGKNLTQGVLKTASDDIAFAVTLELPWRDNQRQISRIPAGKYLCKRVNSPKFGNTFEITGVKGRGDILFHGGNTADNTLGCVLVGHGFDNVGNKPGIVQSQKEFKEFLALQAKVNEFWLTVKDAA